VILELFSFPTSGIGASNVPKPLAVLLTYGTARILLTGNAEAREEEYMAGGSYTMP
jgi:hypothetical protein